MVEARHLSVHCACLTDRMKAQPKGNAAETQKPIVLRGLRWVAAKYAANCHMHHVKRFHSLKYFGFDFKPCTLNYQRTRLFVFLQNRVHVTLPVSNQFKKL